MKRGWLALFGLSLLVWPSLGQGSPPPVTESVTVLANVCAPGAVTPVIAAPTTGTTVTAATITVSGTATANETITIYRNGSVAGATVVDGAGTFTIPITLVLGVNTLVAEGCTQSSPVVVTYGLPTSPPASGPTFRRLPPVAQPESNTGFGTRNSPDLINIVINPEPAPRNATRGGDPFYLQTEFGVREAAVGQLIEYPFVVFGGRGPYQLRAQSGDGFVVETVATERSLLFKHSYQRVGRFLVTIEVIDAAGRQGVLQTVAVISTEGPVAAASQPSDGSGRALALIFMLELLALAALFAVWEYYLRNRYASS